MTWQLNFDSLVNYYVFAHIIAHTDGYAKNMLLSTSLLWSKFEQAFGNEIYERYIEVRNNELTDEKIIAAYEYFIDGIGQDLYNLDERVWGNKSSKHPYIPSRNFRLEQIKQFMQDRQPYTDAWMESLRTELSDRL